MSFAPQKTQLLVVSRTRKDIRLSYNGTLLTPQEKMKILGVTYDSKLTFRTHIEELARRISCLFDSRGRELLYNAQIRSSLKYCCLAWGGAAPTHLAMLDKIQRRAARIIREGHPDGALLTLQHRRIVAGLTTMYKVQELRVPHLQPIRQSPRHVEMNTRAVNTTPSALAVPRSHTSHHQRQFVGTYVRWWNMFMPLDKCPLDLSAVGCGAHKFKVAVSRWLCEMRDSDTHD